MTAQIAEWIIAAIRATGYAGVIALMALESACVPLPSEIIMPFAGFLASTGRLDLWLVATAGAVGCNVGSQIAYEVGSRAGRPAIARFGRFVLLFETDLDRAQRFFERHGAAAVLLGRLLPGVRSVIALPAGIAKMPLLRFHLFTFIGSWPWCFGLALVGKSLGDRWRSDPVLSSMLKRADLIVGALLLLVGGWFLVSRWRAARR